MKPIIHTANLWRQILPIVACKCGKISTQIPSTVASGSLDTFYKPVLHSLNLSYTFWRTSSIYIQASSENIYYW